MEQRCYLAAVWLTWLGLPLLAIVVGVRVGWATPPPRNWRTSFAARPVAASQPADISSPARSRIGVAIRQVAAAADDRRFRCHRSQPVLQRHWQVG
jgi:hypothetical protein